MTDTAADFGDIETADAWDADATIAPEQVTYRLHELRAEVERLGGGDAPAWDDLDADSQTLALAIGTVVVEWIAEREPDNPALTVDAYTTCACTCHARRADWMTCRRRAAGRIDLVDLVITC